MLRVALIAAAVVVAASTAAVEQAFPAAAASCQPAPSASMACSLRAAEPEGDDAVSQAELADLVAPAAPVADWTSWHLSQDAGLDFKDAAAEPDSVLPASLAREHPQPVIPALFALGALVLLLRRRPT